MSSDFGTKRVSQVHWNDQPSLYSSCKKIKGVDCSDRKGSTKCIWDTIVAEAKLLHNKGIEGLKYLRFAKKDTIRSHASFDSTEPSDYSLGYEENDGFSVLNFFPRIGSLFDTWCSPKKGQPTYKQQYSGHKKKNLQLETVCMDCGSILDGYSSSHAAILPIFPDNSAYLTELHREPNIAKYYGYDNWNVRQNRQAKQQINFSPLPSFEPGPNRLFLQNPEESVITRNLKNGSAKTKLFSSDSEKLIQLPQFSNESDE